MMNRRKYNNEEPGSLNNIITESPPLSSSVLTNRSTKHGINTFVSTLSKEKKKRMNKKTELHCITLFVLLCIIFIIFILKDNKDYKDYGRPVVVQRNKTSPQVATWNENITNSIQPDVMMTTEYGHDKNETKRSIGGQQRINESLSKPKFIIHVGPPKTGSTSLQCILESVRSKLEQDDIVYIGRPECRNQGVDIGYETKAKFRLFEQALVIGFDCHMQLIEYEKNNMKDKNGDGIANSSRVSDLPSCWDDFIHHLDSYKEQKKHVIFSDEAMSNRIAGTRGYRPSIPYPFQILKSTLENMGWDVQVLIIHRPLYEYLPSVYNEIYKVGPNKIRLRKWYGDGKICPSQKGRMIPRPFDKKPSTNEITIANLLDKEQRLYPTPAQVIEIFLHHEFKVITVDMTEKTEELDFIQYIICKVFPATSHTCKALLSDEAGVNEKNSGTKQLNPSSSLFYDFIAVEACTSGLLNGTQIPRDVARDTIQRYHEIELGLKPNSFPLICPTDTELGEILNTSLDHQRRICSRVEAKCSEKTKDMTDYKRAFWKTIHEKKKFCTIDVKTLLNDTRWFDFLSNTENFETSK